MKGDGRKQRQRARKINSHTVPRDNAAHMKRPLFLPVNTARVPSGPKDTLL